MDPIDLDRIIHEHLTEHVRLYHPEKPRKGRFVPPSEDEMRQYVAENPELGNVDIHDFWKGYNDSGWVDTQGKPVRNWKLKLRTISKFRPSLVPKQVVVREPVHRCDLETCGKQRRESEMVRDPRQPSVWRCREHGK